MEKKNVENGPLDIGIQRKLNGPHYLRLLKSELHTFIRIAEKKKNIDK